MKQSKFLEAWGTAQRQELSVHTGILESTVSSRGTNEINRMLTVDMILKKAMKGEIDLVTHAMAVSEEIMGIPDFQPPSNDVFERHLDYIKKFKKQFLW